jgi:hypothetical protein
VQQVATWLVFFIALFRTIIFVKELHMEYRLTQCLVAPNINVGKVVWAEHSIVSMGITAFAWAAFGFLVSM